MVPLVILPMAPLVANGTIGLPMVERANGTIGIAIGTNGITNGTIGKTLNDIGIPLVPLGNPEHTRIVRILLYLYLLLSGKWCLPVSQWTANTERFR